jgi:hypothetical protein
MGVAPGGFEPPSQAPKARMIDRYTTGLPSAGVDMESHSY